MRYKKLFGWAALAMGMIVPAAAQDGYYARRDIYHDRRDLGHDYARANRLRGDIARDQMRLNEDLRCGRPGAAQAEARDIARDRYRLRAQDRDIRHDRYHDYRGW